MAIQLSKSQYSAGVQCAKRLYFLIHEPDEGSSPDLDLQMRFQQGQEVGKLARARFQDGVLIGESGSALPAAIAKTQRFVDELRVPAIFEAAFSYDDLVVRVDILKNNFDGTWDLIEVKATTELKKEHLEDVSFQTYVLQNAGVKLRKIFISHINNEVRFPELDEFFIDQDVTEGAIFTAESIANRVAGFRKILEREDPPEELIGKQCTSPYACEYKSQCWASVPKGSVLELYNYRKRKPTKFELYHSGPQLIEDLTNEVELTRFQQIQVLASKTDHPIIDYSGLAEFLGRVKYPIYYFDFETIAPAIPVLTGMRPFQRIPVQFSCHIQRRQGAELEHHEFIASGDIGVDPRRECIDAMKACFDEPGTIVAYHDDFERSLIRELAEAFVDSRDFLLELEGEFWDLEDAFQHHFYHKSFGGSCSIKKVLPYFEPEMKYDKLAIKNGGQAQAALVRLLSHDLSNFEKEKLRRDLLIYCGQDSLAMVVIHQKLMGLVEGKVRLLRP